MTSYYYFIFYMYNINYLNNKSSDLRDYNKRNILHHNFKAFELRGYHQLNINEFCYIIIIKRTENGR